ncbi:MAG TPA: hypothetical protein VFD59_04470 [Nocardioidaceae bacterium]|nr:hypothetical protein [Nocardioidaceae bacterium]
MRENTTENLVGEAANVLVASLVAIADEGGSQERVTQAVVSVLRTALAEPSLGALFERREKSYGVWTDPQRHFLLHASVHRPGHVTEAHDHGECWAVYGVYRGPSRYVRYTRGPDTAPGTASLTVVRDEVLQDGAVDVVQAGEVHRIINPADHMTYNVVVRPRPLNEVWRRRYDFESGSYRIDPRSQ